MDGLIVLEHTGRLISTYGLGVVIACVSLWLAYKYFNKQIDVHFQTKQNLGREKPPTLQELQDHRFFYRHIMLQNVDIRALEVDTPIKRQIAVRALRVYWDSICDAIKSLLTPEFLSLDSFKANQKIIMTVSEAIDRAYTEMLNQYKMPPLAVKWMQHYRSSRERTLFMSVYLLSSNHPATKMFHLLNMLYSDIDSAPYSISNAMRDLNGDLEFETFENARGLYVDYCIQHGIPLERCMLPDERNKIVAAAKIRISQFAVWGGKVAETAPQNSCPLRENSRLDNQPALPPENPAAP